MTLCFRNKVLKNRFKWKYVSRSTICLWQENGLSKMNAIQMEWALIQNLKKSPTKPYATPLVKTFSEPNTMKRSIIQLKVRTTDCSVRYSAKYWMYKQIRWSCDCLQKILCTTVAEVENNVNFLKQSFGLAFLSFKSTTIVFFSDHTLSGQKALLRNERNNICK